MATNAIVESIHARERLIKSFTDAGVPADDLRGQQVVAIVTEIRNSGALSPSVAYDIVTALGSGSWTQGDCETISAAVGYGVGAEEHRRQDCPSVSVYLTPREIAGCKDRSNLWNAIVHVCGTRLGRLGIHDPSQQLLKRAAATLHILAHGHEDVDARGLRLTAHKIRKITVREAQSTPVAFQHIRNYPADPLALDPPHRRYAYGDDAPSRHELAGVEMLCERFGYRSTHATARTGQPTPPVTSGHQDTGSNVAALLSAILPHLRNIGQASPPPHEPVQPSSHGQLSIKDKATPQQSPVSEDDAESGDDIADIEKQLLGAATASKPTRTRKKTAAAETAAMKKPAAASAPTPVAAVKPTPAVAGVMLKPAAAGAAKRPAADVHVPSDDALHGFKKFKSMRSSVQKRAKKDAVAAGHSRDDALKIALDAVSAATERWSALFD